MAEEKVYKHPITNIIMRTSDSGYARVAGYVAYDGDTEEIEFDKVTGIEIAVDGNSEAGTLYLDQSELRAAGLDASGTPEEVHERAEKLREKRDKAAAEAAEAEEQRIAEAEAQAAADAEKIAAEKIAAEKAEAEKAKKATATKPASATK